MQSLVLGRYQARFAKSDAEIAQAIDLRTQIFRPGQGTADTDHFDGRCQHIVVIDDKTGQLAATCRVLTLDRGAALANSYTGQFYDLSLLAQYTRPILEIGRFCLDPKTEHAVVLRTIWAFMTRVVDDRGIGFLCGCSSFVGTDAKLYRDVFSMLLNKHTAPLQWAPGVMATETFDLFELSGIPYDHKSAMATIPALLKTYLTMGGWVSDHAVIDHDLNTIHVFTGLEIDNIPPARARALRALAVDEGPVNQ